LSRQRFSPIIAVNGYSEGMKRLITSRLVTAEHARRIEGRIDDTEMRLQVAHKWLWRAIR
jgi:hypothetical protein